MGAFGQATPRATDTTHDLLGNGWDLTSSEGGSVALFGGSWATDAALVQPEQTRAYESHQPEPFTQFRLAR